MSTSCSPIAPPPHPHHFLVRVLVFTSTRLCRFCSLCLVFLCFLLCCAHFLLTFRKATRSTDIASRKTINFTDGAAGSSPALPYFLALLNVSKLRPNFPSLTSKKRYCGLCGLCNGWDHNLFSGSLQCQVRCKLASVHPPMPPSGYSFRPRT